MLQRCLTLSAIIKQRGFITVSWRAASNAAAMNAKDSSDSSLLVSLPGAHLRPVDDAKPGFFFSLGSPRIVDSLEVMHRTARKPKKANHGKRAVCNIRRRANVSRN